MFAADAVSAGDVSADNLAMGLEFARGAIAGAMVIAIAYLAGLAVFRRSAAATCALLMVVAASAMQLGWLGVIAAPSAKLGVLLQGIFGAAAIVYLSATIRAARENTLLGGVMFIAAVILVGIGLFNLFIPGGDASGIMRGGVFGVGLFALGVSISQAGRDPAARLVLPGVLLALAAPFAGMAFGAGGNAMLAFNALFTIGVVAASLVAMVEPAVKLNVHGHHVDAPVFAHSVEPAPRAAAEPDPEQLLKVSENQLAQVLDYSGIAVWDWTTEGSHQTDGFAKLMGADTSSAFSPSTIVEFFHKDDRAKFEANVLGGGQADGAFDAVMRLTDGKQVRFRGARAVDGVGGVERVVAFAERVSPFSGKGKSLAPEAALGAVAALAKPEALKPDPLGAAISEALAKNQLSTAFQPIVSLTTGEIAGYEALVRWPGENGGPDKAGPEALIQAAEAIGKDAEVTRFVLKAATDYLASQMKALKRRDIFMALNISVTQLKDKDLVSDVRAAIDEHDLPKKALVLEITESQAITDIVEAGAKFHELKTAGAALAFDDFGAGFSSLTNLQSFEFDYLKIDKSFVEGLARGGDNAKIGRAIAQLGRDLGLTVIAEGVENPETAHAAQEAGCALAQGFEFGAPAPRSHDAEPAKHRRKLWTGAMR